MDDNRIERRAEQIKAEQERRREETRRERETMRTNWATAKEMIASLGEVRFEMPSSEWLAKAKWTLRSELSRRLDEATNARAEVAEPFTSDPIWLDGPPPGDFGVWFYKEMLGRVVRAHVLNIGVDKALDGSSSYTISLAPRVALHDATIDDLSLAGALDVATSATIEAMAQSVAAGCKLLVANEALATNKR